MSTKISNLTERVQSDIIGDEFFPIIDGGSGNSSSDVTAYQTFKIRLDTLFQSGDGFEKLTSLVITEGEERAAGTNPSNKFFTLEYIDEAGATQTLRIQKYVIEDSDVAFSHIHPDGYIDSTENFISTDSQLATAFAIEKNREAKEDLLFNNSNSAIKEYFGDQDKGISLDTNNGNVPFTTDAEDYTRTGSHVLVNFRLNTEVAQDFVNLLDGVKPELNTFKKIEEEFDLTTVDRNTKIGTDQVNLDHFRINTSDSENRLNIRNLAIRRELIADNAINTDKIVSKGVKNGNLETGAINARTLGINAVETDKIIDNAVTPDKISPNGPSWDASNVNIPNSLNVISNIVANGNISQKGQAFSIFNSSSSPNRNHSGRALVHGSNDKLSINFLNDFSGGVSIRGVVTVDDMFLSNITAGGKKSVVTKEYVDRADILLNPIGEDKIQDNAIEIRHMTDNSVDTPEIVDEAITSPKIELIGPHWDNTGKVQVSGDLNVAGTTTTIGNAASNDSRSQIILRGPQTTNDLSRGFASIIRNTGSSGELLIRNSHGSLVLGSTSNGRDFVLTGSRATIRHALTISGNGTSTINGGNISNGHLLLGTPSYGIGIDNNEIYQKGDNLHLGSLDEGSNIYFRIGTETVGKFTSSGNFQVDGDIISETGVIRRNGDTANLTLRGGTTDANGATIKLFGINNASNRSFAYYDADKHTFRNERANSITLEIDSKSRRVILPIQGTQANHLINKEYVDSKVIAPGDLTPGGPQWNSTTVIIPDNLEVTDIATVGDNLSVGGQITQTGPDFKIFNPTRAGTGKTHNGRALVHGVGDKLTINHARDYTGGVEVRGKVIAPDQTTTIISSNNKALTTKEYVATEIAKVYPDLSYVAVAGDNMTGDLTWNTQSGNGLAWSNNSDFASIKFYNTGDRDPDCRLEFEIGDNNNEFFRFVMSPHGTVAPVELLKIANSEFSYKGNTIYHTGNVGSGSGLDADKLDGLDSVFFRNASNLNTGTISDSRLPDVITPMTSVRTREILPGTSQNENDFGEQEIVISAGESSGKVPNQVNEYVYINAEGGLSVNTPKVSNWQGGAAGGFNETIITGTNISIGGNTVFHGGNDGAGSGLDADLLDGQESSYYLTPANLNGEIPDSKIPNTITPQTLVKTKEIRTSTTQELILNAGESAGKVSGQVNEYVYVNAEQGLSVNTPKVSNWQGGASGGHNETVIKGDGITISGNTVFHGGNDGFGSGLDADKLDGLHASSFLKPNTQISVSAPTSNNHAATKKYVDDTFAEVRMPDIQVTLLKKVYPVGVLYTSSVATNPNTLFGFGTWSEYGKGRMPIGVNTADSDFNKAGKTGGNKTHTLTIAQMPSHSHVCGAANGNVNSQSLSPFEFTRDDRETTVRTDATGGGAAHNNMPPYITIYMWRRIA